MDKLIDQVDDFNTKVFLEYVRSMCTLYNFKTHMVQRKHLTYKGQKYAGELDFEGRLLRLATSKPLDQLLPILVHEFSHLMQWVDQDAIYYSTQLEDGNDAYDLFMTWITGDIDLPPRKAVQYGKLARDFEADCDYRALDEITFWELPINPDIYIQKSNAYHLLYNYIAKHRFWPETSPYDATYKKIWQSMPTTWISNLDRPPRRLMPLYDEVYGKGK